MSSTTWTPQAYQSLYERELLEQVLPFWETHSIDRENGGFYTCLDDVGNVFDTDKFVWLQGREIWCFAYMYNNIDPVKKRASWLDISKAGAEFLIDKCRDEQGRFYFAVDKEGSPLVQPYNIFSDCFATMAMAALYKATKEEKYREIANGTFESILERKGNTKGGYNKLISTTRNLKGFSLPMILCNLSIELEDILGSERVDSFGDVVIKEVMEDFYFEEYGVILESVNQDGSFSDTFEGRLVNPGHGIEGCWFIMDLATRKGDQELFSKACKILLQTLEFGWDKEYGGVYYFLDIKGFPPQQLEWDQKLWWVHCETLVALAKAYRHTKEEVYLQWFHKVHDYTWTHFRDPHNHGEWFGYLNRRGEVSLKLKGGKWKGCFHVPRALYKVCTEFQLSAL
jgi:N-acylglucosamine 2-epimerase